jgi:uncharacterized protein (TIGR02147 family)
MNKNSVLNYSSFYDFLQKEIEKNTHLKRGEKKRIAEYLNIHPTLLSQIFSGNRQFTDEQVFLLGECLGLSELESDYIFLLHQIDSTQNKKFKERLNKKRDALKNRSLNLSERVEKDKVLTDEEKSIFYSSWQYSAIRTLASLKGGKTREEISERLDIDKKQVSEILEFLVKSGLCRAEKGRYFHHISRTHLEKSSPHLKKHHSNWRIKAIQKMDRSSDDDLTFTAPLSLSNKDFDILREEMVQLIKKISETVKETNPEEIFCFTLDFFRI